MEKKCRWRIADSPKTSTDVRKKLKLKIRNAKSKIENLRSKKFPILVPMSFAFVLLFFTYSYSADLTVSSDTYLNAGHYTYGVVTINNGCTLTCKGDASINTGVVIVCDTLIVNAGGNILANGQGYGPKQGSGKPTGYAGSGYGGYGGNGAFNTGIGGSPYGSIKIPADLGSGSDQTAGGGCIIIKVNSSATINGTISADGQYYWLNGSAGGTIRITAVSLTGSGTITANGGESGHVYGGNGGGGRIALYYDTGGFSGIIMARRGIDGGSGNIAGCGTIFLKPSYQINGTLILDDSGYTNGYYTPIAGTETFDTIIVRNLGHCEIASGADISVTNVYSPSSANKIKVTGMLRVPAGFTISNISVLSNGGISIPDTNLTIDSGGVLEVMNNYLTLNNLTIKPNGTLTHTANYDSLKRYWLNLTVNNNLTIDSGGAINVTGKGYPARTGPGTWSTTYFGGNYGGKGVSNSNYTYGYETAPLDLGSGGSAGPGGGMAYILVWGALTLNGSVISEGREDGYMGVGSGGSVYIKAPNFTGNTSGKISVKGNNSSWGTHGGGGRIAVYYTGNTYSGTYVASGGSDSTGYGSVYSKQKTFHLPPDTPAINNPSYSSPIPGRRPTFVWSAPLDEENNKLNFDIEITQDSSFTPSPAVSASSDISQTGFQYSSDNGITWNAFPSGGIPSDSVPALKVNYTVQQDLDIGEWYWRVRAKDNDGNSAWSEKGLLPSIIGDLVVRITAPGDSALVYDETITVQGIIEQSVGRSAVVNGTAQTLELTVNSFSFVMNLNIGRNTVVVTGNGVIGNYISDTVTIYRLQVPDKTEATIIGAGGGVVRLEDWDGDPDNDARVEIGQGVFERETAVTIKRLEDKYPVYEINFDTGTKKINFRKKVKLILSYKNMNVSAGNEDRLRIFHWDGVRWNVIGGEVDKNKKLVSCWTNHFSKYAVMELAESKDMIVSVAPQTFSPNNDGINDAVIFNIMSKTGGRAEIRIYDAMGRIVRIITEEDVDRGLSTNWDGLDSYGKLAETGIYIYSVTVSGKSVASGTLVVAK